MQKTLLAGLTALLTVTITAACTTSPTGRTQLRLVGDEQLAQMGATAFAEMKQKMPSATSASARAMPTRWH